MDELRMPSSLPLSRVREIRKPPVVDSGDYLIGYHDKVDDEPRFIVIDAFDRFRIAQLALNDIIEAPGPDLGAFIAQAEV